jgi:hypothetical protein
VSVDVSRSHKRSRLGSSQRGADVVEGVSNGVREALHRGNRTESYQGSDQCILNEILTRILGHQVLEKLFQSISQRKY